MTKKNSPASLHSAGGRVLLIMCPKPQYFYNAFCLVDSIDKTVLAVDAAGIKAGEVSHQLFVGRRTLKWVLSDHRKKRLGTLL